MTIRPSGPGDLELLTRLRIEFLADVRGADPDDIDADSFAATRLFFSGLEARAAIRSWIADDGGAPQGVVSLVVNDVPPVPEDGRTKEGLIINMFVLPASRGAGIGSGLLGACLASADELGIRRFHLRTTPAGRQLYERSGFRSRDDWLELPVSRGV